MYRFFFFNPLKVGDWLDLSQRCGSPVAARKCLRRGTRLGREVATPELSVNTPSWSGFRSTHSRHSRSVHHTSACAGASTHLSSRVALGQRSPPARPREKKTQKTKKPWVIPFNLKGRLSNSKALKLRIEDQRD